MLISNSGSLVRETDLQYSNSDQNDNCFVLASCCRCAQNYVVEVILSKQEMIILNMYLSDSFMYFKDLHVKFQLASFPCLLFEIRLPELGTENTA